MARIELDERLAAIERELQGKPTQSTMHRAVRLTMEVMAEIAGDRDSYRTALKQIAEGTFPTRLNEAPDYKSQVRAHARAHLSERE